MFHWTLTGIRDAICILADADVQTTAPYGQVISADLKAFVIVGRAGALQASACASIPKKTVVFCHKLRFASHQMEKVRENPFFQTLCGPCVLDCCCGVASSSGATWSVASFQAAEKFAYYSATGQIVSKGVDPSLGGILRDRKLGRFEDFPGLAPQWPCEQKWW